MTATMGLEGERRSGFGPLGARALWRAAVLLAALAVAAASPWWGPPAVASLAYFHVRRVEVEGLRYLPADDVLRRLEVDTLTSVWSPVGPMERRIAAHPQVREVHVDRKLPGTLVVSVTEYLPVALVPSPRGYRAVDERGRTLPVDPARAALDLPVLSVADTSLARMLAELRVRDPRLFARVSEVRRLERNEILIDLPPLRVRAMADVTPRRLADILPVERDLARRQAHVAELDLRFRDQVVARLQ